MTLQVKWGDQTTQHVNIQQGKRQEAKLSTLLYKRYDNTFLNVITGSHLGAALGTICVASPTCADDIALLGEPQDIQAMLNIIEFHNKRDMVKINLEKSEVLCTSKGKNCQQKTCTLDEQSSIFNRVERGGGKANYKEEDVLQIIMDCSKLSTTTLSHLKADDLIEIDKHSQNFCHQMHTKRTEIQSQ
ncbi:unnamed protein product [Mytilus coruscus]|uniref:Reverse transcriptase domain-containing protein n=1 Tax=Mytilus coruscus TaxID=42192 RepID=A0A6J8CPD8_MYTCO|nr:unnamed protein product [Mytilus coruscus]